MHEQSEIVEYDGEYEHQFGKRLPNAGKRIPGTPLHKSLAEAQDYAVKRSKSFDHAHDDQEGKMAFENFPSILNNMLKSRQLASKDFDVNEHHKRMLTTGPFADAKARHSVWQPAPTQIAMNEHAQEQLDALISGGTVGPVGRVGPSRSYGVINSGKNLPLGEAMTPEQLRLKNLKLDEAEDRLMGRKSAPKGETEDQALRRKHPELFK